MRITRKQMHCAWHNHSRAILREALVRRIADAFLYLPALSPSRPHSLLRNVQHYRGVCNLRMFAPVSRHTWAATRADWLWRAMLHMRWRDEADRGASAWRVMGTPCDVRDDAGGLLSWLQVYHLYELREMALRCPSCRKHRFCAVVYGFPSNALVQCMRANTVVLGGDYLLPGQPCWICKGCGSFWDIWPNQADAHAAGQDCDADTCDGGQNSSDSDGFADTCES